MFTTFSIHLQRNFLPINHHIQRIIIPSSSKSQRPFSFILTKQPFSTTPPPNNNNNNDDDTNNKSTAPPPSSSLLLYQKTHFLLPRAILTFSTLHTFYWTWYLFEFLPVVQSRGLFDVSPTMGYVGMGLSLLMFGGSCHYPLMVIGEISLFKQGGIAVKRLKLPFCTLGNDEMVKRVILDDDDSWEMKKKEKGHLVVKVEDGMGKTKSRLLVVKKGEVRKEELLRRVLVGGSSVRVKREESEEEKQKRKKRRRKKKERVLRKRRGEMFQ